MPGSLPFLLLMLVLGLILLRSTRTQSWGQRTIGAALTLYTFFSVPFGAHVLSAPLSWGFTQIESRPQAQGASAVVVLDGGTSRCGTGGQITEGANEVTLNRAAEAIRVSLLLDSQLIVVSGGVTNTNARWSLEGEALKQELIQAGVPTDRIVIDPTSRNTREHATSVSKLLRDRGITRFVLVTSATHMRRARAAFRRQAVDPIPSAAPAKCVEEGGFTVFWPSLSALSETETSIHEYVGLFYYRLRGWI